MLLFIYATSAPLALQAIAADGWIDQQAVEQLSVPDEYGFAFIDRWTPSVWLFFTDPTTVACLYAGFLAAILSFTVGFASRLSNLLVLVFHLSFMHRASSFTYGVDSVLSMLLLYSLMAPVGARYSLDSWFARRRGRPARKDASQGATLALRCIQVHLCVIYLASGLAKLQGETWWDGSAVWNVVMSHELHFLDLRWLAQWGEQYAVMFSLVGCLFTLVYEVGFPLLIWNRRLRPLFLFSAVALHGGIAMTMGLWSFGATMIVACFSFIPAEWLSGSIGAKRIQDQTTPSGEDYPLSVVA